MSVEAWAATGVVGAVFVLLAIGRHPPYLVLLGGLTALLVTGILEPAQALAGFANTGLITVAVFFVVAAGLLRSGALTFFVQRFLGRPNSVRRAQLRLAPPVILGSALLNNTPVVAMLMPVVMDWSKTVRMAASKLLLPLSYMAILGGVCSLLGSSTNLVVSGLWTEAGNQAIGLFEIAWVGVPCMAAGATLLLLVSPRLLPDHQGDPVVPDDPREYTVEMMVAEGGPLVGSSIEEAGLRSLPGLYLMEIHRDDHVMPAVDPAETLAGGDQLIFVGVVDSVVDLQRIPGLEPATEQVFELEAHRVERCFAEAVVSPTNPVVGRTIRDGRFRTRYNAVVIAVSRGGERVEGRIGDIKLRAGDTVLLEALPTFTEQQRNSSDFYLVSQLAEGPPTTAQAPVAVAILAAMVVSVVAGILDMLSAAMLAAGLMLITRCCSESAARRSIDWSLILAIGASFGLGRALYETGAAETIAHGLLSQAGDNPWVALILIYGTTTLLSELVTNNAAAVIVFPIAMATAEHLQVSPKPFIMALMIAASASFATPLGYQTNLMVYGPGSYRFADFLRMGIPMNITLWTMTSILAPIIWPF